MSAQVERLCDEIAGLRAVSSEIIALSENISSSSQTPGAYTAEEISTALEPIVRDAREALRR